MSWSAGDACDAYRMSLLLLASHTLSMQQRATITAGALLAVHTLCASAALPEGSVGAAVTAAAAPSDTPQSPAARHGAQQQQQQQQSVPSRLHCQAAAAVLLGAALPHMKHADGAVPDWLAFRMQAVLQVDPIQCFVPELLAG